jgi:Uncharacterized protein conserved in bacteria (DUF2255)
MRGAVLYGPCDVRFEERETPTIIKPTDAIIRIAATCDGRAPRDQDAAAPVSVETSMSTWSNDELRKIAAADDLHISPFREDGVTYGTPTWIWSVAVSHSFWSIR